MFAYVWCVRSLSGVRALARGRQALTASPILLTACPPPPCPLVFPHSPQLRQPALETVVPKNPGGLIMVVSGPVRGSKGKLLQSRSSEGVAAVQLSHDFSVHRLMLDDVCEYVGRDDDED